MIFQGIVDQENFVDNYGVLADVDVYFRQPASMEVVKQKDIEVFYRAAQDEFAEEQAATAQL